MLLRIAIIIILSIASAFLVLKFFGMLVGANMFSAMGGIFQGEPLMPIMFLVFYPVTFGILYIMFWIQPLTVYNMNRYHVGGLMVFRDVGLKAMLYDPSSGRFNGYPVAGGLPTPRKFTETFEVASLFKAPSDEYYQNTRAQGILGSVVATVVCILMLGVVYIILYLLSEQAIKYESPPIELSHRFIAERFQAVTGLSPLKAIIAFLTIMAIVPAASTISEMLIIHHYRALLVPHQKELRDELRKRVSPGDTIQGRLVNRFRWSRAERETDYKGRPHTESTRVSSGVDYTIEFDHLIRIPVYLELEQNYGSEEMKELDKSFSDPKAEVPDFKKEYLFIVNPDYAISLKKDIMMQ